MDRLLPDVLLQLVAQQLLAADKIRLARCSTRMMHAIDHAFAWRESIAPLRFCMPPLQSLALPPLLRHSCISLRVESSRHPRPAELSSLTSLMQSCRVGELDLSQCCQVTVPQWQLLCESLQAQQSSLRSLCLYQDLAESNEEVVKLVFDAAPQLTSLRLRALHDHFGPRASIGLELLHLMVPNVTDLSVAEHSLGSFNISRRFIAAVLRNTHLRSLSIMRPQLYENDDGWQGFFADPVAQSLRKLRLHTYFPKGRACGWVRGDRRPVSVAQMIAGWCSMHSLEVLQLVHVADVDAMLRYLRFAPALRSLLIVPDCSLPPPPPVPPKPSILASLAPGSQPPPPAQPIVDRNEHPVPSVAVLLELVRAKPRLRCKLILQRPAVVPKGSEQLQQLDRHLDQLSAPFIDAECLLFTPSVVGRFTFVREDSPATAEVRGI